MRNRIDVRKSIDDILIPYADCICWEDFGSAGNPCYNPNDFSSAAEEEETAFTLAAVQLEMRKYGNKHKELAKKVAKQTGNKYVTYPGSGTRSADCLPALHMMSSYQCPGCLGRLRPACKPRDLQRYIRSMKH